MNILIYLHACTHTFTLSHTYTYTQIHVHAHTYIYTKNIHTDQRFSQKINSNKIVSGTNTEIEIDHIIPGSPNCHGKNTTEHSKECDPNNDHRTLYLGPAK